MDDIFAIVLSCGGFFGIPLLFIWTKHKQKMAELQNRYAPSDRASINEIRKLQEEVARLRDTTTQYDMTVEHTLAEMKQRLAAVESKASSISTPIVASRPHQSPQPQEEPLQQVNQR